jgi:repressor LexA
MLGAAMPLAQRVTRLREGLGLNRNQLAVRSKISATQVREIEEGANTNPGLETLGKVARALGVSVPELLSEPAILPVNGRDHDEPRPLRTITVPVSAVVVGGDKTEAAELEGEEYELLAHLYSPTRRVIRLFGDSMWPTYYSKDLLLVDTKERVKNGTVALVRIGGESTVKRVFFGRKGGLTLKADNPTHPNVEHDGEEVEIIAKVLKIVEGERP